jgi:tripartite-type tricarboxylate transporter receptor subunit TctC
VLFTGVPAVIGQIRNGQLKAVAVSGKQRVEALPDIPTVNEALGMKDFEADQWYGVVAPAGTPAEIVAKLNEGINAALNGAELKRRLSAEGAVANPTTPAAFGRYIASEIERWKPVITSGRVKVD